MIEVKVKQFLEAQLGVEVYNAVPPEHSKTWITVERTGGTWDHGMQTAVLAIQSNAPTLYETVRLNDSVIDQMIRGFIVNDEISRVELNATYNYTNDHQHRYQAVFDVVFFNNEG